MRKVIGFILLFSIMLTICTTINVYAAETENVLTEEANQLDMYLDGYPLTGKIISFTGDVNVYDIPTIGEPEIIDTLPDGYTVELKYLGVLNCSANYFYCCYTVEDTEKYGFIAFEDIEPVEAVITPAPGVDLEYNKPDLSELFLTIKNFINSASNFFASLNNYLIVLFPFFTEAQINFVIVFASLILGCSLYLLFRKVFV